MGTKLGILVIFILLQCSISWAIKPLRGNITTGEEEAPPKEIQEAIEKEKEMKEEVIQRRKGLKEEIKKTDIKKLRVQPSQPKVLKERPPITAIITALIILLVAFYIYRRR